MSGRPVAGAALALALALAGCRSDDGTADPLPPTLAPTTTAGEPVLLGRSGSLELGEGRCWAPLAPVEEAATTTTAPATAGTVVAVADCTGPHRGQVYAAFCLQPDADGALIAGPCPGPDDLPWPGERAVRRATVLRCLERFEAVFGEPYATSRREATEFAPAQGAWNAGQHRVVCTATEPVADPTG